MFFYLSLRDFQDFPGPVALFQDFPILENATIKFQDFPGFPGPVQTLLINFSSRESLVFQHASASRLIEPSLLSISLVYEDGIVEAIIPGSS